MERSDFMDQPKFWWSVIAIFVCTLMATVPHAAAQSCTMASDMSPATRSAIENAANQYFQMATQGNTAALLQAAIPGFQNVVGVVNDNKAAFQGQAMLHLVYILDNTAQAGAGDQQQQGGVEFYCGVFNSPDRVGFRFPNLPAGEFALVVQDVNDSKPPYYVTWILQNVSGQWKIAGLIPRPRQVAGHDGKWYWQQARQYKQQGDLFDAYFYYNMADQLLRPLDALSTPGLDKLVDEWQQAVPPDFPTKSKPLELSSGGNTYPIFSMFPVPVADNLELVVKYNVPDVNDTTKAYQDNLAVMKGLLAKHPQFESAFHGIVARAVAPSGNDYGTMLAMKDIK